MISPDTRTLALEALQDRLFEERQWVLEHPDYYAKWPDVRGDLHRRKMASRIRSLRAAIRELDALAWRVAA